MCVCVCTYILYVCEFCRQSFRIKGALNTFGLNLKPCPSFLKNPVLISMTVECYSSSAVFYGFGAHIWYEKVSSYQSDPDQTR